MQLVNERAYHDAAQAGFNAVPSNKAAPILPDSGAVAQWWIDHVNPYASAVPGRIANSIASADDIAARIDEKLEALRSSITRYAEPPWGAGQQGYGEALDANGVLMDWHLEDGADHCDVCPEIAAGGPYQRGDLPTWPGLGQTPCLDRCRCWIEADSESWNLAFAA